eukprot:15388525-Alexandrium_andersonii.AAC.1
MPTHTPHFVRIGRPTQPFAMQTAPARFSSRRGPDAQLCARVSHQPGAAPSSRARARTRPP